MQPRGGQLYFDLFDLPLLHDLSLGEKIESAHNCQIDKKKQLEVWKFLTKIEQILERLCRKFTRKNSK